MTGNPLFDLLISVVGILALVGFSVSLGGLSTIDITREGACERLAFDEPDFEPETWLIDDRKRSAFAVNRKGELAVIFPMGAEAATRRFAPGAFTCDIIGREVTIRADDHTWRAITLRTDDPLTAARWAKSTLSLGAGTGETRKANGRTGATNG
ncbi:MAG: hypothetical protein AAF850_01940 [Pseudomonadota bacterium]